MSSTCPCGRTPDPGIRPAGGCYCLDDPARDVNDRLVARVEAAVEDFRIGRMTKREFIAYLHRVS